jgi:hypothetical protein
MTLRQGDSRILVNTEYICSFSRNELEVKNPHTNKSIKSIFTSRIINLDFFGNDKILIYLESGISIANLQMAFEKDFLIQITLTFENTNNVLSSYEYKLIDGSEFIKKCRGTKVFEMYKIEGTRVFPVFFPEEFKYKYQIQFGASFENFHVFGSITDPTFIFDSKKNEWIIKNEDDFRINGVNNDMIQFSRIHSLELQIKFIRVLDYVKNNSPFSFSSFQLKDTTYVYLKNTEQPFIFYGGMIIKISKGCIFIIEQGINSKVHKFTTKNPNHINYVSKKGSKIVHREISVIEEKNQFEVEDYELPIQDIRTNQNLLLFVTKYSMYKQLPRDIVKEIYAYMSSTALKINS